MMRLKLMILSGLSSIFCLYGCGKPANNSGKPEDPSTKKESLGNNDADAVSVGNQSSQTSNNGQKENTKLISLEEMFVSSSAHCKPCHASGSSFGWAGADSIEGWKESKLMIEAKVRSKEMPPSPLNEQEYIDVITFIEALKEEKTPGEEPVPTPVIPEPTPTATPQPIMTFVEAQGFCVKCHSQSGWNKSESGWKTRKAKLFSVVNSGEMPLGKKLEENNKKRLLEYISNL